MGISSDDLRALLINYGFYQKLPIDSGDKNELVRFISLYGLKFDMHCVDCEKATTFLEPDEGVLKGNGLTFSGIVSNHGFFNKSYYCVRDINHVVRYAFYMTENYIMKIGQYPSIASLGLPQIEKYRSLLKSDYSDLSRAIGLHAHGVGIGSFVYLRRIFERLIFDTYSDNPSPEIPKSDFLTMRMSDKIKLLKDYLPDILVKNKSVYGILSLGVHELSEDDCIDYFPIVQECIELILDDVLEKAQKKKKLASITSKINDIAGKLKGG